MLNAATLLCARTFIVSAGSFAVTVLAGTWCGWLGQGFGLLSWMLVFSLIGLGATAFALCALRVIRFLHASRRRGRNGTFQSGVVLAASALVVLGWFSATQSAPGENVLGNHDEGMYVAAAAHLARTEKFTIELPDLVEIESATRKLLLQDRPLQFTRQATGTRQSFLSFAVGFPLVEATTLAGPAVPHFPAGAATIRGAAFTVGGWAIASRVSAFAVVVGIFALALVVMRIGGTRAGLVFVTLALLHPLVEWSASRHYAEPLVLVTWGSGLAVLAWIHRWPRLAAGAAGALVGAGALVKIDGLIAVPALAIALMVAPPGRRASVPMVLAGGAGLFLAAALLATQAGWYVGGNLVALATDRRLLASAALVGGAGALMWVWHARKAPARVAGMWRVGIVVVATTILAMYFFRHDPSNPDVYFHDAMGRTIRSYREDTLFRLDWYWLPFGLVAALASASWTAWRPRTVAGAAFACAGFASLLLLGYDILCDPVQPYCMRRMLPFALPFLIAGVAVLPFLTPKPWLRMVGPALIIAFAGGEIAARHRMHDAPDHPGTWEFIQRLAAAIPPEAVVLVPERSPMAAMVVPLRAIWNRPAWVLRADKNSDEQLELCARAVSAWQAKGRRVFVLGASPDDTMHLAFAAQTVSTERWRTSWQPGSYEASSGPARGVDVLCFVNELLRPRAAQP